jgi:glycosyltransferase involved in cell wall biosynthesis
MQCHRRKKMIGVVVPAHNEAASIVACIESVLRAARHPELTDVVVRTVVVVDSCTDSTAALARACGAETIGVTSRNVGVARAEGARIAMAGGAHWLAFTDADCVVADDWLACQLRCNTEVVCGVIQIDDWTGHHEAVCEDFVTTYIDADGHRHIHGANLGLTAAAYLRVGGFSPLKWNEDVALISALIESGAEIAWSAATRVVTSARIDSRAEKGFGAALRAVSERISRQCANSNGARGILASPANGESG